MDETPLKGGKTTTGVVKVGDTVRRPIGEHSIFVHEFLLQLEEQGFPYSPRYLGLDARGREILSFIEGEVPGDLGEFSLDQIVQAGFILRALHETASSVETLRGNEEVICHGDASPCNHVFKEGVPVCLIDFDAAFAGPKKIDYGYGCWLWSNLGSLDQDLVNISAKLRAYMLGYREEPLVCLDAIGEAQDWLMGKLLRENSSTPQVTVEWVERCQRWFDSNRRELTTRLK